MDEESQEEKPAAFRLRSPTFSKLEVKTLINLIENYKIIVLNKSTSASASHAKEIIWSKIAKKFNSKGFKHVRSADCLKIKWENLKKEARKVTKNIIDSKNDNNDILNPIVMMICESDINITSIELPQDISDDEVNGSEEKEIKNDKFWEEGKPSDDSIDGDDKDCDEKCGEERDGRSSNRSLNFTPNECSLLLRCVREEKKYLFVKDNSLKASKLKNRAWERINVNFNKHSPQKRSTKMLRNKFNNMKKLAKRVSFKDCRKDVNNKHVKLVEEQNTKQIKSEPTFDCKVDIDIHPVNEDHDFDDNNETEHSIDNQESAPDPLCTVLNGDSGIGPEIFNQTESREVTKLKIQLLNYQIENAKLERKRIENAMKTETEANETRAMETSLRLRRARLETLAAEMKFPSTHPALHYPPEEVRAQQYTTQSQQYSSKFYDISMQSRDRLQESMN